jgi:Zn-finger nucleic acid-binding protein
LASLPTPEVKCPVCKIAAYTAKLAGEDVLHCAECGGTALKRESMMKLQPGGPKELVKSAEERAHKTPPYFEKRQKPPIMACPYCGKRCKEEKLGPMAVDICEKCSSLWLDGKKIEHLADIIGPYKWKAAKGGSSGSTRRRR